ncbi:hypothetical protein BDY19DRAFT_996861 [Irpex rosettiformis]|uniref:Uncharacterized protein n=1 Tax=Irpex rosettiformis TaxID=378272 RepID=A0ACB8TTW5_9APHY|nr:hypothetical protein BDY19DRAFT_996861 [Irpex rosettiformis]
MGTHSIYSYMLGVSVSLVFELVTVVLTWVKTVPIIRELRPGYQSTTRSLSQVIFYDGTLQLIALILTNTIGLVGFLRQLIGLAFSDLIQVFVLFPLFPVTTDPNLDYRFISILVSRAILDIRQIYTPCGTESSTFHISDMASIQFEARVTEVE